MEFKEISGSLRELKGSLTEFTGIKKNTWLHWSFVGIPSSSLAQNANVSSSFCFIVDFTGIYVGSETN